MQIVPTTTKGLGVYVLAILVMVAIMFSQQYGWFDWRKYLSRGEKA